MILVDTSVWIDHLRKGDQVLSECLNNTRVLMHPFVLGELACGNLGNRSEVLGLLKDLPRVSVANDDEVLFFIERHELMGKGVGYIDAHLLAAARLAGSARLWTRDGRLREVAERLNLSYEQAWLDWVPGVEE
jgi:predicted nucleic acid-binding protein